MVIWHVLFFPLLILLIVLSDWHSHVTLHFFDLFDDFKLGCGVEYIPRPSKQKLEVLCDISASNIYSLYCVVNWESLEDRWAMGYTVSTVKYQTWSFTSCVKRQHSLLLKENFRSAKFLKENVCCLNSVSVRIKRRLSKQNRVLFWHNLELVKTMSPKSLHIVPILNDSVLDRIIQFENSLVFLSSVSNEDLVVVLSDHDFLINWSSNTININVRC